MTREVIIQLKEQGWKLIKIIEAGNVHVHLYRKAGITDLILFDPINQSKEVLLFQSIKAIPQESLCLQPA